MQEQGNTQQAKKVKTKVIYGGALIDGNGGSVLKNPAIVVEGKRIKAVGTKGQLKEPEGAEIIDAGKYTLMPGLFDAHLHLAAFNCATFNNYRVSIWEVTPQLQMLYMLFHAQMCMEMGFTTLRDLGRMTSRGPFRARGGRRARRDQCRCHGRARDCMSAVAPSSPVPIWT